MKFEKNLTSRSVSALLLTAVLFSTGSVFAASTCPFTTAANLRATVATSNAYTTRLLAIQQSAKSVRQSYLNMYASLAKKYDVARNAQMQLFNSPPSLNRSRICSQISQNVGQSANTLIGNNQEGIHYTLYYASQNLSSASHDYASACVTQSTLDLEAVVRQDLDVSSMNKALPSFISICGLLPQ